MFSLVDHRPVLTGFLTALALSACTADTPTDARDGRLQEALVPDAGSVSVCHRGAARATLIDIAPSALAAHRAHGDYIARYVVSHDPAVPDDDAHFGSIGAALSAARSVRLAHGELVSAGCAITIVVSAGTYRGTAGEAADGLEHFPLIIDVPRITLRGALRMAIDDDGRATGQASGGGETTLAPIEPLPILDGVSIPLVAVNAHPGGSAGHGATIEGFAFLSGHDPSVDLGGQGILTLRVDGLTVRGNRFGGGFTESADLRAGNGTFAQNYLEGFIGNCDVCLSGPGRFLASGNRLLGGGIPGIVVSSPISLPTPAGVEPFDLPATAETWADLYNNEVRDHRRLPVGTGIRFDAVGVGAPNVHGTIHATVRENTLANNRFGMIVHAAFPRPGTDLRGDVDVSLRGNVFEKSCQADLLVSLSRHTTALGLTANPYLLASTFRLDLGGNLSWDDAWFGHPAGFGNALIVDGQTIPNGGRHFYEEEGCPALRDTEPLIPRS